MLQMVKRAVLPLDPISIRVLAGPYKGIRMLLSLQSELQFCLGLYETETNYVIRHALRNAQWVMDVGACRGETSLLFRAHGVPTIFAIEPSAEIVEQMKENFTANGIAPVSIINKYAGASSINDRVALDSISVNHEAYGFLKIDVEGAELDVLRGASNLLRLSAKIVLLIETHSEQLEHDCVTYLNNINYDHRIIRRAWWRKLFPEQRIIPHNQWIVACSPGAKPLP